MSALLRFRDVTIRHLDAAAPAVHSVTAQLLRAEKVLLVGPSGAGKSTLLAAASGILPHSMPAELSGSVLLDGVDLRGVTVPEASRTVGTMFQDADAQIVTGRVLDEVCFALENQLLDPDTVERRAREALSEVGLAGLERRHPGTLSGGQRQRLVLACVLAMRLRLCVLDEPTANLDGPAAEAFYRGVGAWRDRALLLVEHNVERALAVVDRVWELDSRGRLIRDEAVGRPRREPRRDSGPGVASHPEPRLGPEPHLGPETRLGPDTRRPRPARAEAPARPQTAGDAGPPAILADRVTWAPEPGSDPVLRDLSLAVRQGAVTALVGGNGAGKSTALRLLAGLLRPTRGRLLWRAPSARMLPHPPALGMVFQNPEHQFLGTSVRGELAHALRLRGTPRARIPSESASLLARFGLLGHEDANPFLLSGGQKRRLSVAIAFAGAPELLLLDEPSYGQDPHHVDLLLGELRAASAAGATVVVSTHDWNLLERCADDIVEVRDGRAYRQPPARAAEPRHD